MIICKYLSLSHKLDYERSGFHSWNSPPLIKGAGVRYDLPKFESLEGVQNFLLERGDKSEKGG